jgi:hypothetical protein
MAIMKVPAETVSKAINAHENLVALFESFLHDIDFVLSGGDTVERYRDKYEALTGKRVKIMGDQS